MAVCNEEANEINRLVTISYVSIQISVALFISIIGAIHVKRCKDEEKKKRNIDGTITLSTG